MANIELGIQAAVTKKIFFRITLFVIFPEQAVCVQCGKVVLVQDYKR